MLIRIKSEVRKIQIEISKNREKGKPLSALTEKETGEESMTDSQRRTQLDGLLDYGMEKTLSRYASFGRVLSRDSRPLHQERL